MLGLLGLIGIASSVAVLRSVASGAECCAAAPSRVMLSSETGAASSETVAARAVKSHPSPPEFEDMVFIPGGTFWMGSDDPRMPDARPWHEVEVDGFWIDRTEVTNEQFLRFVEATGYVTTAERPRTRRSIQARPRRFLARRGSSS